MNVKRFGFRLNAALDAVGAPMRRAARVQFLRDALGLEEDDAASFLGGLRFPPVEVLYRIAQITERTPGHFLNMESDAIPNGMRVVSPAVGNETICVHIPRPDIDLLGDHDATWIYVEASENMGLGIAISDKIVLFRDGRESAPVQPGRHYLVWSPAGAMMLIKCASVQKSTGIFKGLGLSHEPSLNGQTILPVVARTQTLDLRAFASMKMELGGLVVMVVRLGRDLAQHGEECF